MTTRITFAWAALMAACSAPATAPEPPREPAPATETEVRADTEPRIALTPHAELVLVSAERGRELLGAPDTFVEAMSPFDRQARVGSNEPVSEAAFLAHVREQVLPWDDASRASVEARAALLRDALTARELDDLPLPAEVEVVLTTGDEEIPGAAYTRGTSIVFSTGALEGEPSGLLGHELFHVLTRNQPALRDRLYAAIGFAPIPPITLPAQLQARRITNPDAPVVAHAIRVERDGAEVRAAPILLAKREFDGGSLFGYIDLSLVVVDDEGAPAVTSSGSVDRFPIDQAGGFFEQVGRNTQYILHPEEILAENFRLLVTDASPPKDPEILERMMKILVP